MFKQLRVALVTGLLAFTATAAQAQYSLIVNQPANLAGIVSGTHGPATGWGFDPATVPAATGFCQWTRPDSLAGTLAGVGGAGSLAGKIAVCYRGTYEFGVKALNCQNAGAIGVIIVNDLRDATDMGAATQGPNVTIPTILVPHAWGDQLRAEITAGTLNVTIGNIRGLYANNLSLQFYNLMYPKHYAMPGFMVQQAGDFEFPVGGFVNNFGNQASAATTFKAVVSRVSPNPAVLYQDSVVIAAGIAANDSTPDTDPTLFSHFDLVTADPATTDRRGHYQLVYTASAAGTTDNNPNDNTHTLDFYITDNAYSKCELNTDPSKPYLQPVDNIGITTAGGGAFKWGQYHKIGSTGGWVNKIMYAITSDTTPANTLVGEVISVEVDEWIDANGDSAITDDEVSVLGLGSRTYTSNREQSVYYELPIENQVDGTQGIQVLPGHVYFYMVNYGGDKTIFVESNQDVRLYDLTEANSPTDFAPFFPLFNGTNWSRFAETPQPAIRVNVGQSQTDTTIQAVRTNMGSLTHLGLVPNPATDRVQIGIADKVGTGMAMIQIRDMAGHAVMTERRALQGTRSVYQLSTANLPAGVYNVNVSTGNGSLSKRLVVVK